MLVRSFIIIIILFAVICPIFAQYMRICMNTILEKQDSKVR